MKGHKDHQGPGENGEFEVRLALEAHAVLPGSAASLVRLARTGRSERLAQEGTLEHLDLQAGPAIQDRWGRPEHAAWKVPQGQLD